ncbi:MAG: HEPN domain-containing protein [Candidatus Diapherotrites archaeon]|nr:HEPN domain-containing protein [Candidatus Diapherotrites archaeon]
MNLDKLLENGEISKTEPNKRDALVNLELAERDLKSAGDNLEKEDYDWSLAIAYNAMLQAARAFMFHKGYRPKGTYKHLSVVHFMFCFPDLFDATLVRLFDKIRKRRHIAIYERPRTVSESEAEQALANAEEFFEKVKNAVQ